MHTPMIMVGMVTPRYVPEIGGVERYVEQVSLDLVRRGISVEVITTDPTGKLPAREVRDGVLVRRFRTIGNDSVYMVSPGLALWLGRNVKRYAVINAHGYHTALPFVSAVACRLSGVPLVVSSHYHGTGHSPLARLLHVPYKPLGGWAMAQAQQILFQTDDERRSMERDFNRPWVGMNAPSGFDAEELLQARPFDPRPAGKLLLVTGRLEAYKQVDRIVEAVQHLPNDYRLVVLGDGPEREALGQLARQAGVAARVQLLGEVPREALLSWYRSADVLVTMSRHEALGISAMEGAVAGSGVVASDLPSRHLVASFLPPGRMSLISPDCSAAELAAAIQSAAPRVDPADLGAWSIPTWKDCTDVNVAAFQAALGSAWSPLLAVTGPVQRPLSAALAGLSGSGNLAGDVGMRILITGDFYWPIIGGAEHQIRMLAQGLVREGHQVVTASVWHDGLLERELDEGVQVYRLKGWSTRIPGFFQDPKLRHHPPFPDPGVVVGLRRLINRFKPDLVHATGWMAYSSAVALLGKRCPLVVSVREYGYTCAVRNLMYRGGELCSGPGLRKCLGCAAETYSRPKAITAVLGVFGMRRLFRRKVAATISVSTFVRSIVRRDLYDGDRDKCAHAMVLPNIVPLDLLRDAGNDPAMQRYVEALPAEPFILYVGALRPVKGVETLLAAYGKLRGAPPLVLVGTHWPDSPREFRPGVLVLGNLPHPAVMAAWSRCLIGVVPSIWPEPLGNTVREAMCLSKPVVGTSVGGIVDMIEDEVNGLLVPPDDVAELAAAMQRLIDDPDLRSRLGAAGRASVEQLGPASGVPRFEAAYRELIAAAR